MICSECHNTTKSPYSATVDGKNYYNICPVCAKIPPDPAATVGVKLIKNKQTVIINIYDVIKYWPRFSKTVLKIPVVDIIYPKPINLKELETLGSILQIIAKQVPIYTKHDAKKHWQQILDLGLAIPRLLNNIAFTVLLTYHPNNNQWGCSISSPTFQQIPIEQTKQVAQLILPKNTKFKIIKVSQSSPTTQFWSI